MGESDNILPTARLVLSEWIWTKEDGETMKKNDRKESIERIKNALEQAKTNLKTASESGDQEEIKYWSKQLQIQKVILQRVLDVESKRS